MPRTCRTCSHPERDRIERLLLARVSVRDIAGRFEGVSKSGVHRHLAEHLPDHLRDAFAEEEKARGLDLIADVRRDVEECSEMIDSAKAEGDGVDARGWFRERRECRAMLARLRGLGSVSMNVHHVERPGRVLVHEGPPPDELPGDVAVCLPDNGRGDLYGRDIGPDPRPPRSPDHTN